MFEIQQNSKPANYPTNSQITKQDTSFLTTEAKYSTTIIAQY